ncbi:MAG: hypothetical protein AAGE52_41315 [Myxococcota bacterium]
MRWLMLLVLACGSTTETPEVTWNTLSRFDHEEGQPLPASVTTLDGKRVRLRGYLQAIGRTETGYASIVVPSVDSDPLDLNVVVPRLNELVAITSDDDLSSWERCQVEIDGVLEVGERRIEGTVTELYRMTPLQITKQDCEFALTPATEAAIKARLDRQLNR